VRNREFLMLAKVFDPKKHGIGGWYLSEKLDGQRAFWDGGVTRGWPKTKVPWANCSKDGRYIDMQVSTGLWSRYGNVIHAPDYWLDELPAILLDGELWTGPGRGERQELMSIVKTLTPGPGWKKVRYCIFEMPSWNGVFQDGRINNPNFRKIFRGLKALSLREKLDYTPHGLTWFETVVDQIQQRLNDDVTEPVYQQRLPFQTSKALEIVERHLEVVTEKGGEGLMLRKPESFWQPKRVDSLLKVKKLDDDEGTVVGYITGRETDRGSKLLGLMGALVLDYQGRRLELSGFTDAERELKGFDDSESALSWATKHPGEEVPHWISAAQFPRGCSVTFRYRGLTRDGIPQEARYHRIRS